MKNLKIEFYLILLMRKISISPLKNDRKEASKNEIKYG